MTQLCDHKTFCSFWNWLRDLAISRHGLNIDGLAFIDLRDDEIDSFLPHVRNVCERINAPELFGPADGVLAAEGITKMDFRGSRPARATEIRLAWILRTCERYPYLKSEVCPTWTKPFPRSPVNSIETVAAYLQSTIADWESAPCDRTDPQLTAAEKWRALDNVKSTLVWLHQKNEIAHVPELHAETRSAFAAVTQAAAFARWLDRYRESVNTRTCAGSA